MTLELLIYNKNNMEYDNLKNINGTAKEQFGICVRNAFNHKGDAKMYESIANVLYNYRLILTLHSLKIIGDTMNNSIKELLLMVNYNTMKMQINSESSEDILYSLCHTIKDNVLGTNAGKEFKMHYDRIQQIFDKVFGTSNYDNSENILDKPQQISDKQKIINYVYGDTYEKDFNELEKEYKYTKTLYNWLKKTKHQSEIDGEIVSYIIRILIQYCSILALTHHTMTNLTKEIIEEEILKYLEFIHLDRYEFIDTQYENTNFDKLSFDAKLIYFLRVLISKNKVMFPVAFKKQIDRLLKKDVLVKKKITFLRKLRTQLQKEYDDCENDILNVCDTTNKSDLELKLSYYNGMIYLTKKINEIDDIMEQIKDFEVNHPSKLDLFTKNMPY